MVNKPKRKKERHPLFKVLQRINGCWMHNDTDAAGIAALQWLFQTKGVLVDPETLATSWAIYPAGQRKFVMATYEVIKAPLLN